MRNLEHMEQRRQLPPGQILDMWVLHGNTTEYWSNSFCKLSIIFVKRIDTQDINTSEGEFRDINVSFVIRVGNKLID